MQHLYLNYPQYVRDNPHHFRLLLLHNPDMETGVLARLEDIIEATVGIEKLNWTPLPSAFSLMVACQLQVLLAKEPGKLSISTSAQTPQGRQISVEACTHYLEQIQPEELALIHEWCRRMFFDG